MGSGFRTFQSGEVLTADNVQNYLMDQAVMVFAGTAERGSALPSPETGMTAYSTATGLEVYSGSAWSQVGSVVQVKSTAKTDTFSTTSTSFVDVTGLSVSITPTSASNKVLVFANFQVGNAAAGVDPIFRLMQGSTAIFIGDTAGSRTRGSTGGRAYATASVAANSLIFLDSPATTSSTTYKLQMLSNTAVTVYINRSDDDADSALRARYASSITVMEVTP
jgi:hypothetical protein